MIRPVVLVKSCSLTLDLGEIVYMLPPRLMTPPSGSQGCRPPGVEAVQLPTALNTLLASRGGGEVQAALHRFPVLATDAAEEALARLIAYEKSIGNEGNARAVIQRRAGLRQARLVDIHAELSGSAQPTDMPRRIKLCETGLKLIDPGDLPALRVFLTLELGDAHAGNPEGDRSDNLESAIACYRRCLAIQGGDESQEFVGLAHNNIALTYLKRVGGKRAENIELGIHHCRQALAIRNREEYPEKWALSNRTLGTLYQRRLKGIRAENIELAIYHYRQALEVQTRDRIPLQWARTTANLAAAMGVRLNGDQEDNLSCAIELLQTVVDCSPQLPDLRAMAHINLASCYQKRDRGEADMSRVINHLDEAVRVFTPDRHLSEWVKCQRMLGQCIQKGRTSHDRERLERAIDIYMEVLTTEVRKVDPMEWAETQCSLATAFAQRTSGVEADNLEKALACCERALEVFTRESCPEEWARCESNLVHLYTTRIRGDRVDNVERAIAHAQEALFVRTREAEPLEWAITMQQLANAYRYRLLGKRTENLETALRCYQQALEILAPTNSREQWLQALNGLGNVYCERLAGDHSANLEAAIDCYRRLVDGLGDGDHPDDLGVIYDNLGDVYRTRIQGDPTENLEQAITYLERALQLRPRDRFPWFWAMTQNKLGIAFHDRISGNPSENLERAIDHYHRALDVYTAEGHPTQWADCHNNLATAFTRRLRGAQADNMESAIEHLNRALEVHTRTTFPQWYAHAQHNLGIAYEKRALGTVEENTRQAIQHLEAAVDTLRREEYPDDWASSACALANILRKSGRGRDLERAGDLLREVLEVHTKESNPRQWARSYATLGFVIAEIGAGDAKALKEATGMVEDASDVLTKLATPLEAASVERDLAILYWRRWEIGGAGADEVTRHARKALDVFRLETFPAQHREMNCRMGEFLFAQCRWQEATQAFRDGMLASELLYQLAALPNARQVEIKELGSAPARLAYALVRTDPPDLAAAVTAAEKGQSRLLADTLSLDPLRNVD